MTQSRRLLLQLELPVFFMRPHEDSQGKNILQSA